MDKFEQLGQQDMVQEAFIERFEVACRPESLGTKQDIELTIRKYENELSTEESIPLRKKLKKKLHNLFFDEKKEERPEFMPEDSFYLHGRVIRSSKTSLYLFNNKNPVRKVAAWIANWKVFDNFILFLIAFNSILLGLMDYSTNGSGNAFNQIVEKLEIPFTVIFTIEAIIKIIANGLILGQRSYLADTWNWLDFVVVIAGILVVLPSMKNMSGLRTFRLFRPLRSLTSLKNMKILIQTLISSVSQLGGIFGLAIFFFMIFAILGVSLWAGNTHYRCYVTPEPVNGDWELVPGDDQICGYRQCKVGTCGSLVARSDSHHDIDVPLYRDSKGEETNYGITNFDDIIKAFLTIFQCITLEGWTKIMNMMMDAYQPVVSALYFVLCVILCSFFLVNLTIAVMLNKYDELDKSTGDQIHRGELEDLGKAIPLPNRLIQFIIKEENLILKKQSTQALTSEGSIWKRIFESFIYSPIVVPQGKMYRFKITRWTYKLVMMPFFSTFILLSIIVNTSLLALERYPMPAGESDVLGYFNIFFTILFTIEVILKLIAIHPAQFIKDKYNIFDVFVVVISLLELMISNGGGGISALRAFRLFRVFKLFRTGDLKVLLDSIAFTLSTIGNYIILLSLFIYIYALLGMQQFAGKLRFDELGQHDMENGTIPRANFDELWWSCLTIFQILIGDGWHEVMYNCIKSVGFMSQIYFITLILFGNIVMLNLFLAILLGNFEKARQYWLKKKVIEVFQKFSEFGIPLEIAISKVLGDMSSSVKEELLAGEERIRITQLERLEIEPSRQRSHSMDEIRDESRVREQLFSPQEQSFLTTFCNESNEMEELKFTKRKQETKLM